MPFTAHSATRLLLRLGAEKHTLATWSNSVCTGPGHSTLILTPLPARRSSSATASDSRST